MLILFMVLIISALSHQGGAVNSQKHLMIMQEKHTGGLLTILHLMYLNLNLNLMLILNLNFNLNAHLTHGS